VVEKMGHRICFRSGLRRQLLTPHFGMPDREGSGAVIRGRAAMREAMAAQHGIMGEQLSPQAGPPKKAPNPQSTPHSQKSLNFLTIPSRAIDL
jgi:hypothetical protein